jgi:uncharacterized protein
MRTLFTALAGSALCALIAALPAAGQGGPALAPLWQGTLDTGAMKLRIVLHFTAASGGGFTAALDSPDQGAMGLPVEEVRFDGRTLLLEMKRLRARYEGIMDGSGTQLSGQWKQGGASLPLKLTAVSSIQAPRRPQEPRPPFPYDTAEVSFPSLQPGVTLTGTLSLPRGRVRVPAVALLTGSGPQDRDETIFGHKPFLLLADALTRAGMAVLRFDDRGVGGSTAGPEGATSRDFARDALGAAAFLRGQPGVDPRAIGLLGHSEGGLIAVLAAAADPGIAFIVMLAGPGLPGAKLLELQSAAVLRSQGAGDDAVAAAVAANREIYAAALEEKDRNAAAARIRAILQGSGMAEAQADAQAAQILSPWFVFFLGYDPAPDLARLRIPVLALNGETDVQVPAGPNLAAIRAALQAGGNRLSRTMSLPGLNHLMQPSATGAVTEYAVLETTMDPAVPRTVSDWILALAGNGPAGETR